MHVYLTGATGFIGSRVIDQLLEAGHQVTGSTRSEEGARRLAKRGVTPYSATLEDPAALARGAEQADAVIHTAFDHEFVNFAANCEKDRRVISALGAVLRGSSRPILITSGVGMGDPGDGSLAREEVFNRSHSMPRVASELAGQDLLDAGVNLGVVRLPQVHDPVKQGLITPYIDLAREKGTVAYIADGANRFAAAPVEDVSRLYVSALERAAPGARYHAVAEEGVALREIAEVVAAGMGLPAVSLSPDEARTHFGWFAMFAAANFAASGAWTKQTLGWQPKGPSLLENLRRMDYAPLT